jgi:hypothetical protein
MPLLPRQGGAQIAAARRTLRLANGRRVETPLLVPSFSSRGFSYVTDSGAERSEISKPLEVFAGEIPEALLVSAYDLHYRLLSVADTLADPDWRRNPLSTPLVTIIDSGGYEITPLADAGEPIQDLREPRPWGEQLYGDLLDSIPQAAENCAAVGWDRPGQQYLTQVLEAQRFFSKRARFAPIVLLKPEASQFTHTPHLYPILPRLAFASAVGVTEHELGSSLIDRVRAVALIRKGLDDCGFELPLHIFGALDPLYVPLYFAAGADIFDGLTWLRYSYWHGLALHREQAPLLEKMIEQHETSRRYLVLGNNLTQLAQLGTQLRRFVVENENWNVFSDPVVGRPSEKVGDLLRDVYLSAMARSS